MFNMECMKLYDPSMLDGDNKKYVATFLEELVVDGGVELEEDTIL